MLIKSILSNPIFNTASAGFLMGQLALTNPLYLLEYKSMDYKALTPQIKKTYYFECILRRIVKVLIIFTFYSLMKPKTNLISISFFLSLCMFRQNANLRPTPRKDLQINIQIVLQYSRLVKMSIKKWPDY